MTWDNYQSISAGCGVLLLLSLISSEKIVRAQAGDGYDLADARLDSARICGVGPRRLRDSSAAVVAFTGQRNALAC
jgi:hypothetical protein